MGWLSLAGSKGFTDKHECASWRLLLLHAATSCAWCWIWDTALYEAHVMLSLLSQVGIILCFVSDVCVFQTEEGTEVKNPTVNKYLEWCRVDFYSNKHMYYPAKGHFSWYGDVSGMHTFPDNVTTVMRRNVETAHIKWQHKKSHFSFDVLGRLKVPQIHCANAHVLYHSVSVCPQQFHLRKWKHVMANWTFIKNW